MYKPIISLVAMVTAACLSAGAHAQPADPVEHAAASTMANAVTRTTDGVAVHNVFKDPLARTVHVRRDTSGVVERHEAFNDVMIATKGSVTLLLGGRIEGGAETEPGEWRGGTIVGGRQQLFKAGDMLWIPAGVPHQMLVTKGSSFTYSVVKTAR